MRREGTVAASRRVSGGPAILLSLLCYPHDGHHHRRDGSRLWSCSGGCHGLVLRCSPVHALSGYCMNLVHRSAKFSMVEAAAVESGSRKPLSVAVMVARR